MHSNTSELLARLDQSREVLRAAVAAIPAELRDRRPAPERWSALDVLEHLSLAEERFRALVGKAIDEARAAGLGAESGVRAALPTDIAERVSNRQNRRDAPEFIHPRGGIDEAQAWAAFDRAHEGFRGVLTAADGLSLNEVIVAHPALGPLNAYQWAELVARHEERHAEQIREAGAQLAAV